MQNEQRIGLAEIRTEPLDPGPLPQPFEDATWGAFTHWTVPLLTVFEAFYKLEAGRLVLPTEKAGLPFEPDPWFLRTEPGA